MKKENKEYYIPEDKEFYPGFEYEYRDVSRGIPWRKNICDTNMGQFSELGRKGNEYRVEYFNMDKCILDRTINHKRAIFFITAHKRIDHFYTITITPWTSDGIPCIETIAFNGFIKNISELEKILSMVSINYK